MFFASRLAWFLLLWKEHFCQLHQVVVLPGATHSLEEISGWAWHVGNRGRCLNGGKRYKVSHLCYRGVVIQQIDKQVTLPQETSRKDSPPAWFSNKTSWLVLELFSVLSVRPRRGFSSSPPGAVAGLLALPHVLCCSAQSYGPAPWLQLKKLCRSEDCWGAFTHFQQHELSKAAPLQANL